MSSSEKSEFGSIPEVYWVYNRFNKRVNNKVNKRVNYIFIKRVNEIVNKKVRNGAMAQLRSQKRAGSRTWTGK